MLHRKKKLRRPQATPLAAGDVAALVLAGLKKEQAKRFAFDDVSVLRMHWGDIAGEKVASLSDVVEVRHGVATIGVKNRAWAQELSYMKMGLLEKMAELVPELAIKDILFR